MPHYRYVLPCSVQTTTSSKASPRCAYLWCAPGEAHVSVVAGFRGVGGQTRGRGVLRPPRSAKVPDLLACRSENVESEMSNTIISMRRGTA